MQFLWQLRLLALIKSNHELLYRLFLKSQLWKNKKYLPAVLTVYIRCKICIVCIYVWCMQ